MEVDREYFARYYLDDDIYDYCMSDFTDKVSLAGRKGEVDKIKQLILERLKEHDIDEGDSEGSTVLMNNIESLVCVKLLIGIGQASVSVKDNVGDTALFYAARSCNTAEVLKYLLEIGPPDYVNITNDQGNSALMEAIEYGGNMKTDKNVQCLIEDGNADVNIRNKLGETAISLATILNIESCVKILANNQRVDVKTCNGNLRTAVLLSAMIGDLENLIHLIRNENVNLNNLSTVNMKTPLMLSAENGFGSCVQFLIRTGEVEINKQDMKRKTALMYAAIGGHTTCFRFLNEVNYLEMNITDNDGKGALMFAAENGHVECVRFLVETGKVDVDKKDKFNYTAFLYACERGNMECAKVLFETGKVDIWWLNKYFNSLTFAAKNGHIDIIKYLVDTNKVFVDALLQHGSPLICAARGGHADCVQFLLNACKIESDERVHQRRIALKLAISEGHTECVKLLHSREMVNYEYQHERADHLWQRWTESELMTAAFRGHIEILKILVDSGLYAIDISNGEGETAFLLAAKHGKFECLNFLFNTGKVNKDKQSSSGWTALMLAAQSGSIKCVTFLIDIAKVDTRIQNHKGQTALTIAARKGCHDCVQHIYETEAEQGLVVKRQGEESLSNLLMLGIQSCDVSCANYISNLGEIDIHLSDDKERLVFKRTFSTIGYNVNSYRLLMEHISDNDKTGLEMKEHFLSITNASKIKSFCFVPVLFSIGAFQWSWYPEVEAGAYIHRILIRELVIRGHKPQLFEYRNKQASPLTHAFMTDDTGLVRYLMANLYLTPYDFEHFQNDMPLYHQVIHGDGSKELKSLYHQIFSKPWRLETLSLLKISSLLGNRRLKNGNVINLDFLPKGFQTWLLFLNPIRNLCMRQWDKIHFAFFHQKLSIMRSYDGLISTEGLCRFCGEGCMVFKDM